MAEPFVVRPKRRRRPAKSCEQCRARKVKCDQHYPCGQCTRARADLSCAYAPEANRNRSRSANNIPEADKSLQEQGSEARNVDLHKRISRLEATIAEFSNNTKTSAAFASLDTRVNRLERILSTTDHPGGRQTMPSPAAFKEIRPTLRVTAVKTKLFAENHWVHSAKKLSTLAVDNSVELDYDTPTVDSSTIKQEFGKFRATIKAYEMPSLNEPVPDLRGTIPDKAFCDELLETYLATYELIYRTVYIPQFWQEYESFWNNGTSSYQFLMKLVLMLATATSLLPHNNDRHHFQRLSRTWIYACQWWLMGPTEKQSFNMESVQIAVLLQIARQMTGLGRSWSTSGFLLQLAFATGLHRDPDNFSNLPRAQAELRRRLWSSILELTLLASNDTPVPAALELSQYDTEPPQNLDDSDLCDADNLASDLEPADSSPRLTSLQLLLRDSFELRLQASRQIQRTGQACSYEETVALAEKLKDACRQLAKHFSEANGRTESGKFRQSEFHHHILDVQFRQYILALHRPFAICKRHDPTYYLSRKMCIESALIIASHAKPTDGAEMNAIRLTRFFQRTTGSLKGPLSLDIITMLALELLSQLEGSEIANDPAAQFEKASKDQILDALTRISDRLRERVTAGAPKLKTYGLTRAIISQAKAMQKGENPKEAIEKAVLSELNNLRSSLQETVDMLNQSKLQGFELQPELALYQDLQLEPDLDYGAPGTFPFSLWDDLTF